MKAPDFELSDQDGKIHKLSDYSGKWLILYFYIKDDTSGCTKEACNFRDGLEEYKKRGVEIVGISKDSTDSHKDFYSKYSLNFPILSDESGKVVESYGAWGEKVKDGKTEMGMLRNTYLINPEGEIVKEYEGVDPEVHSEELLKDLDNLQN